jgi:hypothetical protein
MLSMAASQTGSPLSRTGPGSPWLIHTGPTGWKPSTEGQMQCGICRLSVFSRLQALQTRAPQQHNRTVLVFVEFKAKAAGAVGLTCRVVILVPACGLATTALRVATFVVAPASPLDGARRARIPSGNIIGQPSSRGSATFRRPRFSCRTSLSENGSHFSRTCASGSPTLKSAMASTNQLNRGSACR